jgi:hypothetical protein
MVSSGVGVTALIRVSSFSGSAHPYPNVDFVRLRGTKSTLVRARKKIV